MTGTDSVTIAQDVAKAAAQDAGTAPADTISVGCELIRAGMFFDGTGNSRDHVPVGGRTWHTNVDLLERNYLNATSITQEIEGKRRKVSLFSIYKRGVGVNAAGESSSDMIGWYGLPRTPRPLGESGRSHAPPAGVSFLPGSRGLGWGTGPEGVENRVNEAFETLEQNIRLHAPGTQPCDIWLDVFGFSRGAVAARDFVNGVKDREFAYGDSRVRTKFLGLFDTVSSMGEGGNTGEHGNVSLKTSGNVAERIVHITAKDEIRQYFPLTLAMTGERIEVVGAHSDIGGGYLPERYKSTFFYLPMHYPGIQEFYESRWGRGPTSLEPDNQINEDEDNLLAYGEIRPTSEVCLASTAEPGLQFVSLRLMHDRALSAGVPFEERLSDSIGAGAYSMPSDLNDYYLALTKGDTDQAGSMEVAIRRKYAHVSFNNESSFGVYPNLPEPSGIRRVARL